MKVNMFFTTEHLQSYFTLKIKLVRFYKILKSKQFDWLKNILILIDKNMLQIILKKAFFKLMNNSTFGKTMENLRHRMLDLLIMLGIIKSI